MATSKRDSRNRSRSGWRKSGAGVSRASSNRWPTSKPTTDLRWHCVPFQASEGALYSEQEFSLGPDCLIRMSVPELVWREAGTRVLKAAGIEEVGPRDALSTFQEVLSQTFSGRCPGDRLPAWDAR